jgi:uncharacterized LabA/DUF88 family protein
MHFSPSERIALFIDGANLYPVAHALGFDIDYRRLLLLFRAAGQLVRAHYYTTIIEHAEGCSLRPLVDWLDYNGFTVITKPSKKLTDLPGTRKASGNMHIELAVDAIRLANSVDHVVLFSGDGDFRSLIESLQTMGKRVSVVSTLNPPMVADELRRQADQFIDLAHLKAEICRAPSPRPERLSNAQPLPDRA